MNPPVPRAAHSPGGAQTRSSARITRRVREYDGNNDNQPVRAVRADYTVTVPDSSLPETFAPAQARYQVRFDFGSAGLRRLADADIIVWVDALPEAGSLPSLDDVAPTSAIILGALTTRSAVADWILRRQVELGRRLSIALVAAGFEDGFASHDLLAAGAIIEALADRGIDFTSPEAAVAGAAYAGLRQASGHLFTASVVGQNVRRKLSIEPVKAASQIDSQSEVVVLRESPIETAALAE